MTEPLSLDSEGPRVKAVDGEVVVTGDGVCTSLTPEAARASADRLLLAADFAEQQQADVEVFEL